MTGYGKHVDTYKGRVISVEIRTLNSKQADLNLRIPTLYREQEFAIRDRLIGGLERGKMDVSIQRELAPDESSATINAALVKTYAQEVQAIAKNIGSDQKLEVNDLLQTILKFPDVLKPNVESLEEEELKVVMAALDRAIENCQNFRLQEGLKLKAVLEDSVEIISSGLQSVEPLEPERMERIKEKLSANLLDDGNGKSNFDRDRYEQELIFYLEKLDITEEKVRLNAHCEYFLETLSMDGPKGKKLSFIAQEMGREINTLGSKAQHSEIQKIVVDMKDNLEKIKEQVLNVL